MGKHNTVSGVLVMIVLLMIAVSAFLAINYATSVLSAAVAFASTDQVDKFQACGITVPPELSKLRADVPGLLVPAIYVGFPGLMILIAMMMFIAGYFYGHGKEAHSVSSETTTTTSSPNRDEGGKYEPGRRVEKTVEKTQTHKSSKDGN